MEQGIPPGPEILVSEGVELTFGVHYHVKHSLCKSSCFAPLPKVELLRASPGLRVISYLSFQSRQFKKGARGDSLMN